MKTTTEQTDQKPPVKKRDEIKERWQKEATGNSSEAVKDPALDPLQDDETGVSEPGAAIIHSGANSEKSITGNGTHPLLVTKTEGKERASTSVTATPFENLAPVFKQKARQTGKEVRKIKESNALAQTLVEASTEMLIKMVLKDNNTWVEDPAREPGDIDKVGKLYPAPEPYNTRQKIVEALVHFGWPEPDIEVVTDKVDPSIIGLPEGTGVALLVHFHYLD